MYRGASFVPPAIQLKRTAGKVELISGEMRLGSRYHGVDLVMPVAQSHAIDVGAIFSPGFRHELQAPMCVALVPRREVSYDRLIDVA